MLSVPVTVPLGDGSAEIIARASILSHKLEIQFAISSSQRIPNSDQPPRALTLSHQAVDRAPTRVSMFQVTGIIRPGFLACLFACLSQQQASVSQGPICSDFWTCCHTKMEAAHRTFCLTQSQYTDAGPTSRSADPVTPGVWQGSHLSSNF